MNHSRIFILMGLTLSVLALTYELRLLNSPLIQGIHAVGVVVTGSYVCIYLCIKISWSLLWNSLK